MQKLTKPDKPLPPKLDAEGRPVPDPMVQQQKMMSFMMLFFGLLFYNFPSGLNLYILSSNLLGMLEQYRIKKHIRERDARGEFEVKKKQSAALGDGKPSFLERLAKKAEDARFAAFLPLILRESADDRNFVKKAVNWALRQIGKRNPVLNGLAVATARAIGKGDAKTARWIAADALRELTDEKAHRWRKKLA